MKFKAIVNSIALLIGLGLIGYSHLSKKNIITSATTPQTVATPSDWKVKEGSIYDGDTLRLVDSKGQEEIKIRLCGIDAPEIKQEGGIEARDYLRSILKNVEKVHLIEVEKDRYGRMVGEVFVDRNGQEFHINAEMVMKGMAWFYPKSSRDCPNREGLMRSEQIAREDKVGIWRSSNPIPPWEWRKRN